MSSISLRPFERGTVVVVRLPIAGFLVILALAGCASPDTSISGASSLTQHERRLILWWLQCEECIDGELDTVRALGQTKAAAVDTLGEDLLGGPSSTRRSNVQQQFTASYLEDSVYAVSEGAPLGVTRQEYVGHYLDNFINLYRKRAALALATIGGTKAGAILDSAAHGVVRMAGDTLRADAQLVVLFARDSVFAADTIP